MGKKSIRKDFYMEIIKTRGRFISIFFIVALGVAFFTGIRSAQPDMKQSADSEYDASNLMDIRVLSTLGLTADDIEALKTVDGVQNAVGAYSTDMLAMEDTSQLVVKVYSFPKGINEVTLKEGRLPHSTNECLVDTAYLITTGHKIGDTIHLKSGTDKPLSDTLHSDTYTITGSGSTALYLSRDKGTSSIGSGNVNSFIMIPEDAFALEAYTESYVTVDTARDLLSYSTAYENKIDDVTASIKSTIMDARIDARYKEVIETANNKLDDAYAELSDGQVKADKELAKAKKKLDAAAKKIKTGQAELARNEKKIEDGWTTYYSSYQKLKDGKAQLANGKKKLDAGLAQLEDGQAQYEVGVAQYNASLADLASKQAQLDAAKSGVTAISDPVEAAKQQAALDAQQAQLDTAKNTLATSKATLDQTKTQLDASRSTLNASMLNYETSLKELTANEIRLAQAKADLENGESQLESAKTTLEKGQKDFLSGLKKYEKEKAKTEKKLADAAEKISDAKLEVAKINKPKWYVLDRNSLQTYVEYGQDADRIGAIGKVFPVIFFLVAALVSLTTMTRMVEEQRTQIGTLKALGYSKTTIASKYVSYALFATLGGSILGAAIGSKLLPYVIIHAYQIMYENLTFLQTPYQINYIIMATFLAVFCVVAATVFSCYKELATSPAELMRPAAPKLGKRVLLERIPFIWNRLNFTGKSTIRNLIRYKKRFFMTILGIGGCMSLLLVGYGIKDSISSIVDIQYSQIHLYDGIASLDTDETAEKLSNVKEYFSKEDLVTDSSFHYETAMKTTANKITKDAYLSVLKDSDQISKYYNFRDRIHKTPYTLTDDSVIITEKLARLLGIQTGDTISIRNDDFNSVDVTVGAICENYIMHYIFMSPALYEKLYQKAPDYNQILYLAPGITSEKEDSFSFNVLSQDGVVNNTLTNSLGSQFGETLKNMDVVILVLIVSAAGLAFIVLYNLNNINISERRRELATLKVLGFYDLEVSEYVFRENIILTIIGALTGVILGFLLHRYLIVTVEIDMIMFGRSIHLLSYAISILLTFLFAMIINLSMHFKLKTIDMATSLKSVE